MTQTSFGQPLGGVFQIAYTVPDLERAMHDYISRMRVGPWFVRGPFVPPEGRCRGQPTDVRLTLARAFTGHLMLELIQQHNEVPSVFHEPGAARRYGFHHWALVTPDLDADIERYRALGAEAAFSDRVPTGGRIVYMDTTRHLPGMIELVELTDAMEREHTRMYAEALAWDGERPVRHPGG